jgi:hypothetical protein
MGEGQPVKIRAPYIRRFVFSQRFLRLCHLENELGYWMVYRHDRGEQVMKYASNEVAYESLIGHAFLLEVASDGDGSGPVLNPVTFNIHGSLLYLPRQIAESCGSVLSAWSSGDIVPQEAALRLSEEARKLYLYVTWFPGATSTHRL